MLFFTRKKKKVKDAYEFLRKKIIYSHDILAPNILAEAKALERSLKADLNAFPKDPTAQASLAARAETQVARLFPPARFASWTENIDVLLMAIVLALGIRAYFIQPFKIPTDSMKPTLYGIQVEPQPEQVRPALPLRIFEWLVFGKTYCRIEPRQGGVVRSIREGRFMGIPFLPQTEVVIGGERFTIWCSAREFVQGSGLQPGDLVPGGTAAANFTVTSGDHVFVNKIAYHFRRPERGEVFVFTTHGIDAILRTMRPADRTTQFYIKRCVGLPGDILEIDPPRLMVNGQPLNGRAVFTKMATRTEGYRGYQLIPENPFLGRPGATFTVPPDSYWAMGDNSGASFDSRGWGPVPRANLVGTGLWVYWPVSRRWGWIE